MNGAEDSTYSTEVPSFKEIGTHTVDYKITSTNYEDLTGTFDVQVQKMDLANAYVGFTNTPQIYNGSAIDPGVTVKGTETSTDAISASEYTGSCTKKIEVRKADLTNAEVEINGTYTYSGEAQEPGKGDTTQVQVTLDNIPVDLSEYTLEYANNTVAAEASSNTAPKVPVKAIADGN